MKKLLTVSVISIYLNVGVMAQPSIPLPKQIIARPQTNAKLLELNNVITGKWRGARLTQLSGAVNVDSLWIEFKSDGTVRFKHQQYEFNGPSYGNFFINKNKLVISANKFPFNHTLDGQWNINTGMVNGRFTEIREQDESQPAYYTTGTNTGTFSLVKY